MRKMYLYCVIISLCLCLVGCSTQEKSNDFEANKINKNESITVQEQLEILEKLGIEIPDNIDEVIDKNLEIWTENYYEEFPYVMLMGSLGLGTYDYEKGEFYHDKIGIFSFDAEVYDFEKMHFNLSKGISALTEDDFVIKDVKQKIIEESEEGIGTYQIEFTIDDTVFTEELEMYYDWVDANFISYMNKAIEKKGYEKRLYVIPVLQLQGMSVFYCTEKWAMEFEEETGYKLSLEI